MNALSRRALVRAERLSVGYSVRGRWWNRPVLRAVDAVDLDIAEGEVLALVGESGSGKTTLGRALLRLVEPTQGEVFFDGKPFTGLTAGQVRPLRRQMQIIFQDPFASLDPRMTVGDIVAEGLVIHGAGNRAARSHRVAEMLALVGLDPDHARRYPHAMSGGQRQRVGIARALAVNPRFVVADEPVSSLDVSVQAQIINVLADLRSRLGLTMLFISHNLGVVRVIADRVAVMYLGKVIEVATTQVLFDDPAHPYTQALLASMAIPDPTRRQSIGMLRGELPSGIDRPPGCVFHTRCPYAEPACAAAAPPMVEAGRGQAAACIRIEVARAARQGRGLHG
jgi:oligopeptide/dipeptide ABC transporter ATP-binding protein